MGHRQQTTATMVMRLWALSEESKAHRMRPESSLYDDFPAHRCLPTRTPTSASPGPCSYPSHPEFKYPPLFGWGNMNPMCARTPDPLFIMCRHRIRICIRMLPAMHPLLWPSHHQKDLTTPVFDIGESSGEACFPLCSLHHHENGTNTFSPIFPMPLPS